jgi:hypothetical protein
MAVSRAPEQGNIVSEQDQLETNQNTYLTKHAGKYDSMGCTQHVILELKHTFNNNAKQNMVVQ